MTRTQFLLLPLTLLWRRKQTSQHPITVPPTTKTSRPSAYLPLVGITFGSPERIPNARGTVMMAVGHRSDGTLVTCPIVWSDKDERNPEGMKLGISLITHAVLSLQDMNELQQTGQLQ